MTERLVLPTGQAFAELMYFISLMAVRVPATRSIISGANEKILKQVFRLIASQRLIWEGIREEMKNEGMEVDESFGYDEFKKFVDSDKYRITTNQNWLVSIILQTSQTIYLTMIGRTWSIVSCDADAGGFISSDRPAVLVFTKRMPPIYSPGFGLSDTELTFPLNKRVLLIGRFDGKSDSVILKDEKSIAYYNGRTASHAERFFFSSREEFTWLDKDKTVKRNLLAAITAKRG